MVTQEMYNEGIRCRGMCFICHEQQGCIQYKNEMINKLPLGIEPRYIWIEKRIQDIKEAINRYCDAGVEVPFEWVDEYNELTRLRK